MKNVNSKSIVPEIVYVYHEYTDDQAYGEQFIQVFRDRLAGQAYLKRRVEEVRESAWEAVAANAGPEDTVEPDYVSIKSGDANQFFVLEEQPVV